MPIDIEPTQAAVPENYRVPQYTGITADDMTKLDYSPVDVALMQFDRPTLFRELRARIKKAMPELKLEYGYCSTDFDPMKHLLASSCAPDANDYNQRFLQVDYTLVYRYYAKKDGGTSIPMAYIICPSMFSSKSLHVMAYYKMQNRIDEFMADYIKNNVRVPWGIFIQYLTEMKGLSVPKKTWKISDSIPTVKEEIQKPEEDPNFWKNPARKEKTVVGIQDFCIEYNPGRAK